MLWQYHTQTSGGAVLRCKVKKINLPTLKVPTTGDWYTRTTAVKLDTGIPNYLAPRKLYYYGKAADMLRSTVLCPNCCASASAHPSFFLLKGSSTASVASPVQLRGRGTLPVLPRGSPPSSVHQKLKQKNCAPSLGVLAH